MDNGAKDIIHQLGLINITITNMFKNKSLSSNCKLNENTLLSLLKATNELQSHVELLSCKVLLLQLNEEN
jgi:hypothetical protein